MTEIRIRGAETPSSFRPIWMAEELGLEYEHLPIGPRTGETKTPEYTAMTRKQKIPFMVDGEVKLSESVAICRYLLARYPSAGLAPPETLELAAKHDEWTCYIYGEIDETGLYVMRRHGDLAELYGASDTVLAACKAYVGRHLDVVASHLEGREYLTDSGFAIPDLLLMSCLDWSAFYGIELPERVSDYRNTIAQRPAYQRAMQKNYPILMGGQ